MRRLIRLLPGALLLASACSSPGPFTPDGVIFWEVVTGEVSFQGCPDSPAFSAANPPLDVVGHYLVYRISPDGLSAVQQDCDRLDPGSCLTAPAGLTWSIQGTTLRTTTERRDPVGTGGCSLLQSEAWVLEVIGQQLGARIVNTLSLAGLPLACDQVESAVQAQAPNGHGLAGCQVTTQLDAVLR